MGIQTIDRDVLSCCSQANRASNLAGAPDHAVLLARAALLPADQRQLLHLVLLGPHSLRTLARMVGINAGTLSRRINSMITRLRQPVVAALSRFAEELPDQPRRLAIGHFVYAKSVRALSCQHKLTRDEVVAAISYVSAWAALRNQAARCA